MTLCAATLPAQTLPKYDHIVIVIEENKNDTEIRGNFAQAPYINNVLIPNSADFSAFVAETHPSQPNYLHFFSGSQQGILQDGYPGNPTDGELASFEPLDVLVVGVDVAVGGQEPGGFELFPGCRMVPAAAGHRVKKG